MPFLRNLVCSMRRLHVNNWMVIAMDNATCPTLMGAPGDGEQSACVYPYARSAIGVTSSLKVATYRSMNFNRVVMQRPLWVKWLLEQGYMALHVARLCRLSLLGSNTGVYLGYSGSDFSQVLATSPQGKSVYSATGSSQSIASGRLPYVLGLHGACARHRG